MTAPLSRFKALILSGLFLFGHPLLFADAYFQFGAEAQTAYSHILALRFEEAERDIRRMKERQPKDHICRYLEGTLDFVRCLIGARESDCRRCIDRGLEHLQALRSLPSKSPWQYYAAGELHAMIGIMYYLEGSSWKATLQLRQAVIHIREGARLYPDFLPLQKDLLALRSMVDAVPEQFIWLAEWISGLPRPSGGDPWRVLITDMEAQLHFMTFDARLFQVIMDIQIRRDMDTAFRRVQALAATHPGHQFVMFLQAYVAREAGHNDLAIEVLKGSDRRAFPYLEFMLGKSLLYRLEATRAAGHFDRFTARWPGQRHRMEACQKRAWCDLLNGDMPAYRLRTAACASLPRKGQESDAQAWYEWQQERSPHTGLLRARLLMDGGYAHKAQEEINRIAPADLREQEQRLEYHYRRGRIAQLLGRRDQAIRFLETAWNDGRGGDMHFACAAALYLGHLYADAGHAAEARHWYDRCLREKPDLYRQGLHQKARLALRHLEG